MTRQGIADLGVDLEGLQVVVGDVNQAAVQDGLSADILRTDVTRALLGAGINVLTK